MLQKLDFKGKWFSRFVDRMGTRWLRLSAKVASGALFHAKLHGAQRIFCGHTHAALSQVKDGIEYYNTGSWDPKEGPICELVTATFPTAMSDIVESLVCNRTDNPAEKGDGLYYSMLVLSRRSSHYEIASSPNTHSLSFKINLLDYVLPSCFHCVS